MANAKPVFVDKVAVTLRLVKHETNHGWMALGEDFSIAQHGFFSEEEARKAANDQPLRWNPESIYLCCWCN